MFLFFKARKCLKRHGTKRLSFHRINYQQEVIANASWIQTVKEKRFLFVFKSITIVLSLSKIILSQRNWHFTKRSPQLHHFCVVYFPCCSVEGSRVPQIPPMVTKNCCLHSHQEATNMAACGLLRSLSSNFFTALPLASRSSPLSPLRLACKPYFGRTLATSSRVPAGIVA